MEGKFIRPIARCKSYILTWNFLKQKQRIEGRVIQVSPGMYRCKGEKGEIWILFFIKKWPGSCTQPPGRS